MDFYDLDGLRSHMISLLYYSTGSSIQKPRQIQGAGHAWTCLSREDCPGFCKHVLEGPHLASLVVTTQGDHNLLEKLDVLTEGIYIKDLYLIAGH